MSDGVGPAELERLAARIRAILARGVTASPQVMGFIESTLPLGGPPKIASALADACAGEAEPVLALLFFPEESLQAEIEELLAGRALTAADEQRLAARLAEPPLRVAFEFPGAERLELEMTPDRARGFIDHLRLTRAVPKALDAAAAAALAPAERNRFRVLWRNARCAASGESVRFLGGLLRRGDLREPSAWACLGYLLEFLAEADAPADIYRRLAARKALLVDAVHRNRRQRAELARSNLETMLSRGARLVSIDEQEVRRQVACIDQACLSVYGRIAAIDIGTVSLYDTDT
ncbi:MAG: hypothetical protein MUD16_03795 [Desulfobacterales bacterium]|jgi:hypothetical protein|nr:hypothetical protein [Desulfobacterales bacterium]